MTKFDFFSAKTLKGPTGRKADEPLGKLVDAKADESRLETARKTVEFMERMFGKNNRDTKAARAMYEKALQKAGVN